MSRAARLGLCLLASGSLPLALAGWGMLRNVDAPPYAHITLFDGEGWVGLSLHEKELLVEGFLLGAAAEQALKSTKEPAADGRAVARAVADLRETAALDFSFAPSVLARRADEFYWWRNNRDVPLVGVLVEITHRLRTEHF